MRRIKYGKLVAIYPVSIWIVLTWAGAQKNE